MLGAGSLIEMMISIVSHISSKRCRLLLDVRTSYVARCALSSSCTYVYVYLSMVDTSLPLSHACSLGSLSSVSTQIKLVGAVHRARALSLFLASLFTPIFLLPASPRIYGSDIVLHI